MACTMCGCGEPAVRALVNVMGWVHLECARHAGSWDDLLECAPFRLPEEVRECVRRAGRRPAGLPYGSGTMEVGLEVLLALEVMTA